jgi:hypothetical protein
MGRLLIFVALVGFAYWYWSGHQQESTEALEADQFQENAVTMQRCINQEQRMQSTGGLGGLADVGSSGADAESLCAEKNGLYKRDGHWYRRQD